MTHHIFVDNRAISLCVVQHMWSWSHDTHVTSQHVQELWKFVYVGFSHEVAKGELARIVLCSLRFVGVFVDVHRAKFNASECLAIDTCSVLTEEDWSRTLQLDYQCNDGYDEQ